MLLVLMSQGSGYASSCKYARVLKRNLRNIRKVFRAGFFRRNIRNS